MTFVCDACGLKFEDRLDHIDDCQGPFPASWWSESDGDVLWWCWDDKARQWLHEAPYVGSPLDLGHTVEIHVSGTKKVSRMNVGGWPGYHTHWTRIVIPVNPHM